MTTVEGHALTARGTSSDPVAITFGGDGRISDSIRSDSPASADAIILPGLVNAHSHAGMSVLRGFGNGRNLEDWLQVVLAAENTLEKADLRWALRLALCEMVRSGTTAFADMFLWDDDLIEDVVSAGLRCAVAPTLFGPTIQHFTRATSHTYRQQLDAVDALHARWNGHDLIRIFYGPHAVYTAGEDVFREIAMRASRTGIPVHVHLNESSAEVRNSLGASGATPIEVAHRSGLLTDTTLIAHAVHVSPSEIEILANAGATVSHNPASNLKLASGIAPVVEMIAAGVNVALGTDGPASSDSLDLLSHLRLAVGLQRGRTEQPSCLTDNEALAIATANGSAGLGFEPTFLSVGDLADVVVLKPQGARAAPMYSPSAFVHWSATAHDVDSVFVNGRPLMLDRELLTLDEDRIVYEVKRIASRLGAFLN